MWTNVCNSELSTVTTSINYICAELAYRSMHSSASMPQLMLLW